MTYILPTAKVELNDFHDVYNTYLRKNRVKLTVAALIRS